MSYPVIPTPSLPVYICVWMYLEAANGFHFELLDT